MGASLLWRDVMQIRHGPVSKRATRSSEQNAAHAKGVETQVFFTGAGVFLTLEPGFAELEGKAKLWVCDVSFRTNGLHGREDDVPGVGYKDFVTQGRNAEMLAEVQRYIVM